MQSEIAPISLCAARSSFVILHTPLTTPGGPMRHSLFLSTLFAVSMIGGAALAEKPQSAAGHAPRVIENLRAHGDTVDKVYRAPAAERSSGAWRSNPGTERAARTPNV